MKENMKTKKRKCLFLMSGLLFTILITGCSSKGYKINEGNQKNINQSDNSKARSSITLDEAMAKLLNGDNIAIVYDSDDRNINIGIDKSPYHIAFEGKNIILSDNSIGKIVGSKITIQKPGTYVISGTLNEGQIIVNSEVSGIVHLIFDGVSITSKNSAPLYIKNSTKTVLTLNNDTKNYLIDGNIYEYDNVTEEMDAALFSQSNLTINGSGQLNITANYEDGIASNKELKIIGSNITVKAKEDGIIGKDYLAIESGTLSVVAGGDGLKSTNSKDVSLGHVVIDGGTINTKATHEGIQAETTIKVNNGKVNITSKGDGMYALANIYFYDGKLGITSHKDGIQGNKSVYITGGEITLTTTGGSSLTTAESSSLSTAEGSGLSTAEGSSLTTGSGSGNGGKGIKAQEEINVLGGTIEIDSAGAAMHSGQFVQIYGGTINIQSGSAVIHAGESFALNGGYLIAVGSSPLEVTPIAPTASDSSQYSVLINYETTQKANTLLRIEDEDGNEIVSYVPKEDYQFLVVSSSSFEIDKNYHLYSGGSVINEESDDLHNNETYSDGKLVKSFEITSITTRIILETD